MPTAKPLSSRSGGSYPNRNVNSSKSISLNRPDIVVPFQLWRYLLQLSVTVSEGWLLSLRTNGEIVILNVMEKTTALMAALLMFCVGCSLMGRPVSTDKLRDMTDAKLVKFCDRSGERSRTNCYKFDSGSPARYGCEQGTIAAEENLRNCMIERTSRPSMRYRPPE